MPTLQHVRLAARFARHRFAELHPFEVQAMLLNACNLKCSYCSCPEIKTSVLTTEQWTAVVRRLGALGTMRIKWQGGEPTLRRDFDQLCSEVQRAGILCAVVTNGTLIPEHPELLDHVDEVVFSLDSLVPEHNDAVRGAGVHALVMQAIEVALRKRGLRLFINMVVNRNTFDEIDPMLRFCEERGIGLNAQPVLFGLDYYDEDATSIALGEAETRAMFRQMARWKQQGRPLMFAASTYEASSFWPDYRRMVTTSEAESGCAMGRFYVHVEANGDIRPCIQNGGEFRPLNLVQHGLDEALRHARHHHCSDCFSAYLNERKAIFGLRPRAVFEFLRRS